MRISVIFIIVPYILIMSKFLFTNKCTLYKAYKMLKFACMLPGTQYTHHSLKHMLPQYSTTYNDVLLLINSTKV